MATVIVWDADVERSAIVGVHPIDGHALVSDHPSHEIEWFDSQLPALMRLRDALLTEAAVLMARTDRIAERIAKLDMAIRKQQAAT